MSDRKTIRQWMAGKKTVTGVWLCALAGMANLAGIWTYMHPKIPASMFMVGLALVMYGVYSRIMFVFYPAPRGKPDTNRPKLHAPRIS